MGAELEAYAARRAVPRLTAGDFAHLEQIIAEMAAAADEACHELREAPAARTPHETSFAHSVELNVAFHRFLVERAGHKLLLRSWLLTNPLNWRFVTYTRTLNPDPVEAVERHREVLNAYRSGDVAQA